MITLVGPAIGLVFALTACGDTAPDPHHGDAGPITARVVATSLSRAIDTGAAVLAEGGHAVDAALAIALDQCTLTGGSWNSFAGIMTLVVYDAASGEVSALSGGYQSFAAEGDPLTIPTDAPSGRTALVPGFFDAVLEAHGRYGRLPLERVAESAITHAEEGFVVDAVFAYNLSTAHEVLTRLPETRAVFTREDGSSYQEGDLFRQPQLAETLRRVVDEGRAYVYEGDWAESFVAAVRAEGGAVTVADLADYRATWTEPLLLDRGRETLVLPGEPNVGGAAVAEAFVLADAAGLDRLGRWDESAEALYWLARVNQVSYLSSYLPLYAESVAAKLEAQLHEVGWSLQDRLDPERAARMIDLVESGRWDAAVWEASQALPAPSGHSDAIVVVDHDGNVAALTHTLNSVLWGNTGIIVDGVMIPDSGALNRAALATIGSGARLPDPLNPSIVLRDGRPVVAGSTIGNPQYAQLQRLYPMLAWAYDPQAAAEIPPLSGTPYAETVAPGTITDDVLDDVTSLGLTIIKASDDTGLGWVGIALDAETGEWSAGFDPWLEVVGGGARAIPPPQ